MHKSLQKLFLLSKTSKFQYENLIWSRFDVKISFESHRCSVYQGTEPQPVLSSTFCYKLIMDPELYIFVILSHSPAIKLVYLMRLQQFDQVRIASDKMKNHSIVLVLISTRCPNESFTETFFKFSKRIKKTTTPNNNMPSSVEQQWSNGDDDSPAETWKESGAQVKNVHCLNNRQNTKASPTYASHVKEYTRKCIPQTTRSQHSFFSEWMWLI